VTKCDIFFASLNRNRQQSVDELDAVNDGRLV